MSKLACVAVVRNEGGHIAEWVAWQFAIGFDTVILLDNGSTDDTRSVAGAFSGKYDLRLINWPRATADYQIKGYEFVARGLAGALDWVAFFDTDEFLVLDHELALRAALNDRPEAAAIGIPWAIFGSSGHRDVPPGLVTEAFLHRAPADFFPNRHIKSIIRPSRLRGPLNAHAFDIDGEYTSLTGQPMRFASPGLLDEAPDYRGGKLHHYFTRSWASWQDKVARGWHDQTRLEADFFVYDRNDIFDDSAVKTAGLVRLTLAAPTSSCRQVVEPRLGIAISTFNRKSLLLDQLAAIEAFTPASYDLVVCDDGSTDGTYEILRERGVNFVSGFNRGIAWNKNRGIYYLVNVARSDVILLLDDDIIPTKTGWQAAWISAARRFGHVNHAHPAFQNSLVAGALTADYPGLASTIPGWALAFSRLALSQIGYFDIRFGRYGHEHSDMSFRAVRAGFGGIEVVNGGADQTLFFVIEGDLAGVPSQTTGTEADLEANGKLLATVGRDQIYRHAWRDDAEMAIFLEEIHAALGADVKPAFKIRNRLPSALAFRPPPV